MTTPVETLSEISVRTGITNPVILRSIQEKQKQPPKPTPREQVAILRAEEAKVPIVPKPAEIKWVGPPKREAIPSIEDQSPEEKFHTYVELGAIPAGSLYAGRNPEDKAQPMYYETTPKQLQQVEQQFLKDIKDAPVYIHDLMVRSDITPAVEGPKWNVDVESNYDALMEQWDSLLGSEKQKLLGIYYWQASEEEGRAFPISLPKTGMLYVGAASEAIKKQVTSFAHEYLPPDMEMPVIAGVSVVTTIGEMAALYPLMAAEIAQNPAFIKDIAIGMKDFTVDAAKGVGKADPWAIGQMAVIVGTLYLGGKPLIKAVAIRTPAMASKVKVALAKLDTAIRGRSKIKIQRAGADLKAVGEEVGGPEGATLVRLGDRVEIQAEGLRTVSTRTIDNLKFTAENSIKNWYDPAWLEPGTQLKPRVQPKPRPTITKTRLGLELPKARPDITIILKEIGKAADEARIRKAIREYRPPKTPKRVPAWEAPGRLEALKIQEVLFKRLKQTEATRHALRKVREQIKQEQGLLKQAQSKAKQIVERAKANEVKIRAAAEKSLAELKGMTNKSAIYKALSAMPIVGTAAMLALGSKQMIDALAAVNAKQATKIIAKIDPALQTTTEEAVEARVEGLTVGLTQPLTEDLTETETEALTEEQAKVKAKTEEATQVLEETATETLTERLIDQAIKTQVKTKLIPKKKGKLKRRRGNGDDELKIERVEGIPSNPGIITYNAGIVKVIMNPPYREGTDDIDFELLEKPQRGKGSQEDTLRVQRGKKAPRRLELSRGVVRTTILGGKKMQHSRQYPQRGPGIVTKSGRVIRQRRGSVLV